MSAAAIWNAVLVSFVTRVAAVDTVPLRIVSSAAAHLGRDALSSKMLNPTAWQAAEVTRTVVVATAATWKIQSGPIAVKMMNKSILSILILGLFGMSCQTSPSKMVGVTAVSMCQHDAECVHPWHPGLSGCVPQTRCVSGQCLVPAGDSGEPNPTTGKLSFDSNSGAQSLDVEIADDNFERARGMMCRTKLRKDWGMLFLMPTTRIQSFWMKNTLIPLDMVFIDEHWTVVGIVDNVPQQQLQTSGVDMPSRYVLEVGAGEANRLGIFAGQLFHFEPAAFGQTR